MFDIIMVMPRTLFGLLSATLMFVGCATSTPLHGDADVVDDVEVVAATCEPLLGAPCPDDRFLCDDAEPPRCVGQVGAATPTEGTWSCEVSETTMICHGDTMPTGPDWFCAELDEPSSVHCMRTLYVPAQPADAFWSCQIDDAATLSCDEVEPSPPPDGGFDPSCICIPGASRYCTVQGFARWGEQLCSVDGQEWEPCQAIESPPESCAQVDGWFSPAGEACGAENALCLQDTWDLDNDGDFGESLGDCTDIVCM